MKRQHIPNINTGQHFDNLYAGPRRAEMLPVVPLQVMVPSLIGEGYVLDVGCGWGQYFDYLNANGATVHGVDFAEASIQEAKELYPYGEWKWADFSINLPYGSDYFDYVTCFETLEHMEDPARLISEICRVLRPNGTAILTVPYRNGIITPEHIWEYDEDDWRGLTAEFKIAAQFRYGVGPGDLWEHFLIVARK